MTKVGRPKVQVKMTGRLNTSVTPDDEKNFNKACRTVGLEPAYVLRHLASAFTDHITANGSVLLPIRISGSKPDKPT